VATPRPVRIGIVGGGLMGRELAAAVGRWSALEDHPAQPVLTAVCDPSEPAREWFRRVASVTTLTDDRRRLLENPRLDVLYLAVPHHLHEELYLDAIAAGKDFLGEKPFGIDLAAARRIVEAIPEDRFVRCSSEMPYFPGAQRAYEIVRSGALGRIFEAHAAFLHSSDLDLAKPINWKRQARYCGELGVIADLGMHVVHLPLRLGWEPQTVHATIQDIVTQRPGADGTPVPCDTPDNATLHATVGDFPLTLETKRIAPGHSNTWSPEGPRPRRRRRVQHREPEGPLALRAPRRPPALAARADRQRVGVRHDHRPDLRVRLPRRDPADVGRLPRRARGRARRPARLRHAAGGAAQPRDLRRGVALGAFGQRRAGSVRACSSGSRSSRSSRSPRSPCWCAAT
jgi:predicted dehydrogenase